MIQKSTEENPSNQQIDTEIQSGVMDDIKYYSHLRKKEHISMRFFEFEENLTISNVFLKSQ